MKHSISPLDGRYEQALNPLRKYFSEEALMYYRILIEIRWFQHIATRKDITTLRELTDTENILLEKILSEFSDTDASQIKEIEKTTNHDVKAVEYFLKQKTKDSSLEELSEWIHFSLTSEDVNNLAYALMFQEAIENIVLPELKKIQSVLSQSATQWKSIPMLSRTHGQPASPTTLGKEMLIFSTRLHRQISQLQSQEYLGKIAGASGNYNAHIVAFPDAEWFDISKTFVNSLGLTWNPVVSQIEPHDFIAELSHTLSRINIIFIDMSRDIWGYITFKFFKQHLKKGEVGSSAMPHKVNPIDFENAEGNFGIGNALFHHFAEKLPISRWQRDLSDSTVLRNIGVAIGHHYLGLKSLQKGLSKLEVNTKEILNDLRANPEILAEAVQTVMRSAGIKNPYEKLKEMTRGKHLSTEGFQKFISLLDLPNTEKSILKNLTPETYIGLADEICEKFIPPEIKEN